MIKVALIGTHATGKSTICHELVAELKKKRVIAEYLGEIARDAQKAGFRLNEDTTQDSQRWILHTQIARELEFLARPDVDVLVCDRSALDNYVYFVKQFGHDEVLDIIVNEHMQTYAHLFKVPINLNYLTPDNVRSINPVFQRKIDSLLDRELRKRKIDFKSYIDLETALKIIGNGK